MKNVRGTGAKRPKVVGNVGYRLEGSNKFPDVDVELALAEVKGDFEEVHDWVVRIKGFEPQQEVSQEELEEVFIDMAGEYSVGSTDFSKYAWIDCYFVTKHILDNFDTNRTLDEIEADLDFVVFLNHKTMTL